MNNDDLHFRILMRTGGPDYILCRETGIHYNRMPFYDETRYPYTVEGLQNVRVMVEALKILMEADADK